jgi:hypothetical protein
MFYLFSLLSKGTQLNLNDDVMHEAIVEHLQIGYDNSRQTSRQNIKNEQNYYHLVQWFFIGISFIYDNLSSRKC